MKDKKDLIFMFFSIGMIIFGTLSFFLIIPAQYHPNIAIDEMWQLQGFFTGVFGVCFFLSALTLFESNQDSEEKKQYWRVQRKLWKGSQ